MTDSAVKWHSSCFEVQRDGGVMSGGTILQQAQVASGLVTILHARRLHAAECVPDKQRICVLECRSPATTEWLMNGNRFARSKQHITALGLLHAYRNGD
jgi:hypothetical protein